MTRLEIHVERLVLRGVPEEYAIGLGARIERRLTELIEAGPGGEPRPDRPGRAPAAGDPDALADLVAERIRAASREGGMPW
ncbi:hypothetical protein [Agromyces sp. ZXT2-3]|uniref:hypothetical protein n=1 Tax=Agromyces sp. ZXT2-3 TaxID=3461152 RepID=UPI004054E3F6